MGLQALSYFVIKSFLTDYNVIHSILDVPLIKGFVYFYDSWYPFILLITFIIYKYDKKIFKYLIVSMLLGALMSHITFLIYPSMVERPIISVKNITDFILYITYKTDTPAVNCLPSMHCVYCFITSYFIYKCSNLKTKYKALIITYSMLIVLSTLFIKQHVIEDVILAFIYVVIVIIIVNLSKEKINKTFKKINLD